MDHFTRPIESICSNKLAYYSVHHLDYMSSLLAAKPGSEVSEVLLVQRGRERETYEIAFDLPVSGHSGGAGVPQC